MAEEAVVARLNAVFAEWRSALERRALVRFESGLVPTAGLTPAAKADAFSAQFGCTAIGFNWEMMDPSADLAAHAHLELAPDRTHAMRLSEIGDVLVADERGTAEEILLVPHIRQDTAD